MDLLAYFAPLLPLGDAQGILSGCGVLPGPVLDTCSFWALLTYNLGSYHDVSSLEHRDRIALGTSICDGWVCPSQEAFLQLNGAETKERGWEEAGVERMMKMVVDENMEM